MRTEQEMFDLILREARENESIRAVYMNGSRTNPNAVKDILQDYDIVYVVRETRTFYEDVTWIDRFGERLYMQMPEYMDKLLGKEVNWEDTFGWLILFRDGNRLDLHVNSIAFAKDTITQDKLCQILLDKDQILPVIEDSTDVDYFVQRPSEASFHCNCNEFWWCLNNVAKGLWREEIPYVMDMINYHIRPELIQVLAWKIGIQENFGCSIGKSGKYMYRYLSPEDWDMFLSTYPAGNVSSIWSAVFSMCDLFARIAVDVANALDYTYLYEEEAAARFYLEEVFKLPKDSEEVFNVSRHWYGEGEY